MASSRLTIRWWTLIRARQVYPPRIRARISPLQVLESLRARTTRLMPPTNSSSKLLMSPHSSVQEVTPLKLRGQHRPISSGLTLCTRHKISAHPIVASQRSLRGTAISIDGSKSSPSIQTFLMGSPSWSASWDRRITRSIKGLSPLQAMSPLTTQPPYSPRSREWTAPPIRWSLFQWESATPLLQSTRRLR